MNQSNKNFINPFEKYHRLGVGCLKHSYKVNIRLHSSIQVFLRDYIDWELLLLLDDCYMPLYEIEDLSSCEDWGEKGCDFRKDHF